MSVALPNDHGDKDSSLRRQVGAKKGISGAVLPVQEGTHEGSPEQPTTPTPRVKRPHKRKPLRRRLTTQPVTETVTPAPPAETPPSPTVSDQHFEAVDEYGQACYVTYMYGANQAMAMAVETTKTGKAFDPRSVDLPSMGALVGFYHACAGFPVKQSWLKAIKAGNYNSLPGLTYANASRYCPDADETTKGHLAQQRQNIQSTKPKPPAANPSNEKPIIPPGEKPLLFVKTYPISKLYTDDT